MQRKSPDVAREGPKPKRGRPRVGAEVMDSATRKRRWTEQMRNEGGNDPQAPRRSAVQVYLSDDARAVFAKVRALAKELGRPSISNSVVVERLLLLALGRRDFVLEGVGYTISDVLSHFKIQRAKVAFAEAQLRLRNETPVRLNKRSLPQILERIERPPSREAIAMEIKRAHNTPGVGALHELVNDLRPLLAATKPDRDFEGKLRRRIEAYLERLFGLS